MIKCVKIRPKQLKGNINIPSSKSLCHRAVIAASLSEETSNLSNILFSDDIIATTAAMKQLGAKIENIGDHTLKIKGTLPKGLKGETIDCKESGSTLRFLIPISLYSTTSVVFDGRGKLVTRPLDSYYKIFHKQNIKYSAKEGGLPLKIDGRLKSGEFEIEGHISSQFITGLLFTLPLLQGDSKIKIIGNLESKAYVDLTIDALKRFGIDIENNDYKEFKIKGCQKYKANDYKVEGDFSQAAFWLVAGILGEEIESSGL